MADLHGRALTARAGASRRGPPTIPAEPVRTILDFGCGRGAWTPILRQRFPNARITGLDVSEAAVERAASDFPDATFAAFDGDLAPYDDRAFDLVFSYHVLEHVLSLEETAAEMSRLADRWICVCLPCRNDGSLEERMVQRTRASSKQPPASCASRTTTTVTCGA